jgi:hypothetical protein
LPVGFKNAHAGSVKVFRIGPMRASRLRQALLTPSNGDTTFPVPSIQVTAREQAMNAPPKIDRATVHSDSDVLHWLTNDTHGERFIDNIIA